MNRENLRQLYAGSRDALPEAERHARSLAIWKRLSGLDALLHATQALFYVASRSEVETQPMFAAARAQGIRVCVPRSDPFEKSLTFYHVTDDRILRPGAYGILEPPADAATLVDLAAPSIVLVPGLAFDSQGGRLGWGQGYYDRFLGGTGRGMPSVGLAFDIQIAETLPLKPHDIPVQWIVTESRVIHVENKDE